MDDNGSLMLNATNSLEMPPSQIGRLTHIQPRQLSDDRILQDVVPQGVKDFNTISILS